MAKHLVNLDALIMREDFEVKSEEPQQPSSTTSTFRVGDLDANSFVYDVLRKPDFQRETADWEPEKVADLIQSFLEGDLIPSIILWRSESGNIFVIDGAHRLSALIAWVHDDYGDRSISVPFFDSFIPEEQYKAAERTRQLVKERIGSYIQLKAIPQFPDNAASPEQVRYAKNLGVNAFHLQWVPGDARKAESSYFKINQKAAIIDATELAMIQSRRKPNAMATRALIRAGTGHKYWAAFTGSARDEIEKIGHEVYETLFKPALETPIKTLDLPVGGRGYSADSVRMIFDLVNFVNGIESRKAKQMDTAESGMPDDLDGTATLRFLRSVRQASSLIAGTEARSLGLHPAVYFYGATGRFQPTAFLTSVAFMNELHEQKALSRFTEARCRFEEFLLRYRHFTNLIARNLGSAQRGLQATLTMYRTILDSISDGKSDEEIVEILRADQQLKFLTVITDEDRKYGRNFSTETKNAAFLREALEKELRCKICQARMHFKSISFDHIVRKQDGGGGSPENAQMTHPYCNTGYKESLHAKGATV